MATRSSTRFAYQSLYPGGGKRRYPIGPQMLSVRTDDLPASAMTQGWITAKPLTGLREVSTTIGATYPGQDESCWCRAVVCATLYLMRI